MVSENFVAFWISLVKTMNGFHPTPSIEESASEVAKRWKYRKYMGAGVWWHFTIHSRATFGECCVSVSVSLGAMQQNIAYLNQIFLCKTIFSSHRNPWSVYHFGASATNALAMPQLKFIEWKMLTESNGRINLAIDGKAVLDLSNLLCRSRELGKMDKVFGWLGLCPMHFKKPFRKKVGKKLTSSNLFGL